MKSNKACKVDCDAIGIRCRLQSSSLYQSPAHPRKPLALTTPLNWHIDDFKPSEITVRLEVKEVMNLDFRPDKFVGWFVEIFPKHRFHAVALAE